MIVHFLITGYLFVQSLIGIDPVRHRLPYPFRLLLLLATMAFHAFFGLSIMQMHGLLLADWFGAMGRTWGDVPARRPAGRRRDRVEHRRDPDGDPGDRRGDPVEPQRRARDEAPRPERRPHRRGRAEAYNARLARMAQRDSCTALSRGAGATRATTMLSDAVGPDA